LASFETDYTGMHGQQNIKKKIISLYSTNLLGFYNREEKFLQRGTDWVFK